jgi:hypothetical protein
MEQDQQLSGCRDDIDAATASLAGLGQLLWQAGSGDLGPAARQERHTRLREALLAGRVPVRAAAVCLEEMDRLRHRLTPEAVPSVWEALLSLAADGGPRQIRRLRPALLARYGQDGELDRRTGSRPWPRCPSRWAAATGCSTTSCAWARRPRPSWRPPSARCPRRAPPDGVPDLRPARARRADALIELVRRAVSAPETVPTTAQATLFLTIGWDDLVRQVGAGATIGSAETGTLLAPGTVRKLACDAGIIPTLLGTDGHVLDLGREWRWFTPAQTKALSLRDRACTIPGCGMPAQWCHAHHLWHFADGGPTNLDHAALLCGYHHTWAHQHRLAGRLQHGHVTWDLTPGSYDTYLRERRPDPALDSPCLEPSRDRDTDRRLEDAGWTVVHAWEHESPGIVADRIVRALER